MKLKRAIVCCMLLALTTASCADSAARESSDLNKEADEHDVTSADILANVPAMYIEPAQLTEEEEAMAQLLGSDLKNPIYDFYLDDTVETVSITAYELKDGNWKLFSRDLGRFYDNSGRFTVDCSDLSAGFWFAIQSDNHYGSMNSEKGECFLTEGMQILTSTLTERTEIAYEQEIPIAVQVCTTQDQIISSGLSSFFDPDEYSGMGYEHIYAVTIKFSQKTFEELYEALDQHNPSDQL